VSLGNGPFYLSAFRGLAKSQTFCTGPRQEFATPSAEGQRNIRKIYPGNARSFQGFVNGLGKPG